MQLILASASPRRKELLSLFGVPFVIRVADIDETMDPRKLPFDEVARVSRCKAMAVEAAPEDVVIAADTIVVCEGRVLGKPGTEAGAREMLRLLSGRDHQVMTGVTVRQGELCETFTDVTDLHFRALSDREIDRYVASGEPMDKASALKGYRYEWQDKAGGYGIQTAFGAMAIKRIEGDYYNVVGLPVSRLYQKLKELNVI